MNVSLQRKRSSSCILSPTSEVSQMECEYLDVVWGEVRRFGVSRRCRTEERILAFALNKTATLRFIVEECPMRCETG